MRLGGLELLRELLGGRDSNGILMIGRTYASALKQGVSVIGLPGWRYVIERSDDLVNWTADEFNGSGFYRARIP